MRRALLVSLLLVLIACGREVPRPRIPAAVRSPQRVIFIGIDGAEWQMLDPLMQDGTMPNLARLVREGDRRVLLAFDPPLPPLVWTTEMTGVSPLEHRILDFNLTSNDRAVPAIWNMVTYGGKRVAVVGMWVTNPPEAVNGTIVPGLDLDTEGLHRVMKERIASDRPDLAIVDFHRAADFHRLDAIIAEYVLLARQNGAQIVLASDHGPHGTGIYLRWHPGVRLPAASRGEVRAADICGIILNILKLPAKVGEYRGRFRRTPPPASKRTAASFANEGLLLRQAGRNDEAIAAFENALRLDPKNAAAMWNLSDLLHRLHRDPQRADALLDQAIAVDGNQPAWLLDRGRYRLEKKDCLGARDDFARASALEPNNAVIFASLGTAETCLGNRDAANRAFQRSLQIDPNQPASRK